MISQQELFDFLPDMIYHQDEPIADNVCIPLYFLAKLVKDSGTTVVQVGEGSDELFAGYSRHRFARLLTGTPEAAGKVLTGATLKLRTTTLSSAGSAGAVRPSSTRRTPRTSGCCRTRGLM